MLQIVICDDEPDIVDLISEQLDTIMKNTIKYNCFKTTNPKDVIRFGRKKNIDLLLIDIEMPGMSGFEMLEQSKIQNDRTLVIFVTNMDLYVYESLKYRPFRFIRKSHLNEMEEAITSAILLLKRKTDVLSVPINTMQHTNVMIEDIIYFESLHNDVRLVTVNNEYTYRSTLKTIEAELEGYGFVRIHSAYLLNVKYIYLIKQKDVEIYLGNSKKNLPVSRDRRNRLISEYNSSLR